MAFDAEGVIRLASEGTLVPGRGTDLFLQNVPFKVQQRGGYIALVLSKEGKLALARGDGARALKRQLSSYENPTVDTYSVNINTGRRAAKAWGFGLAGSLPARVDLHHDVEFALVDPSVRRDLLAAYGSAVAKGQAPREIAGQPYEQFFHASDDFQNDLEVAAFQQAIPGFDARPLTEQKAIAALAGRVAADGPPAVDATLRRRVASLLVYRQAFPRDPELRRLSQLGPVRPFFHGTTVEDLAWASTRPMRAAVGSDHAIYGDGVYFGNPSVARSYAFDWLSADVFPTNRPAAILDGHVAVGNVTTKSFEEAPAADTRFIARSALPRGFEDNGDYWVTRDPSRFVIEGVTRYDPKRTRGFEAMLPELLAAYTKAPEWVARHLDRIDRVQAERGYVHALSSNDPDVRMAAGVLLSATGRAEAIAIAIDALKSDHDAALQKAAADALVQAAGALGPDRDAEVRGIVGAIFGAQGLEPRLVGLFTGLRSVLGKERSLVVSEGALTSKVETVMALAAEDLASRGDKRGLDTALSLARETKDFRVFNDMSLILFGALREPTPQRDQIARTLLTAKLFDEQPSRKAFTVHSLRSILGKDLSPWGGPSQ